MANRKCDLHFCFLEKMSSTFNFINLCEHPDCQETVCDSKSDTKFAVLFSGPQTVSWQSVSTSPKSTLHRGKGGGGGLEGAVTVKESGRK